MAGSSVPGPTDPTKKPTATQDQTMPVSPGQGPGPLGAGAGTPPPAPPGGTSHSAKIKIEAPKEVAKANDHKPIWSITGDNPPKMPVITVNASIVGITTGPNPTATTEFTWTAEVKYNSAKTPHGVAKHWAGHHDDGDTRKIPAITVSGKVVGGNIVINNFPKIRGGDLKITVTARVGNHTLKAETKKWRIQGTNPTKDTVANALPDDTHRKIACNESQMMQFYRAPHEGGAWYPYLSSDRYLGVGICQLTSPEPTDDQFWDWTENVKGGIKLYNDKKREAEAYPGKVEKSPKFLDLVRKYNKSLENDPTGTVCRVVNVHVPPFTADQLEDDTIRGFNGWGGNDGFVHPHQMHEFRIKVANGMLVVEGDPATGNVNAKWERVPAEKRQGFQNLSAADQEGVKHYVENVKKRNPRTCSSK